LSILVVVGDVEQAHLLLGQRERQEKGNERKDERKEIQGERNES
jgi:hypothetical protein